MQMKSEIKARWVEALRSGKYRQTQGVLSRVSALAPGGTGYCCLGVLRELYRIEIDVTTTTTTTAVFPDNKVLEWAGLRRRALGDPGARSSEQNQHPIIHCEALAEMNDGGMSFNDIAAVIEEKL